MKLKAVFLNCTLKKSPVVSNTEALIKKVVSEYKKLDVTSEVVRVVDYQIPFGVSSNEGVGDEWPKILKKLQVSDIIIIAAPI
jgi:multimeric flavodoxin WrbA